MISRSNFILYLFVAFCGISVGILYHFKPFQTFVEHLVDQRINSFGPKEFVDAAEKIKPSVVGVVVTKLKRVQHQNGYSSLFRPDLFSGSQPLTLYKTVHNMGSGVIVDSDGHVLTSNHIVEGAEELSVAFSDGRRFSAFVVGGDSLSDLAVIRVDSSGSGFLPAKFVEYDSLSVGEFVLAVGNPFLNFFNSADPTVTLGVVSALHRNFRFAGSGIYQDMIQTDAAINPGNSGGPLINSQGEVAGINSFIYTGDAEVQGSVGIGFAIPGSRALHIAQELKNYGRRRIAWTGLNVGEEGGVVITDVALGGPGDLSGIKIGDRLVRIADRRISTAADIIGVFLPYFPGDSLKVAYVRDGKEFVANLVLVEVP